MSVHYQRSRELAHVSELPKVVPAVLPKHLDFLFAMPTAEAVNAQDLQKEELHERMKTLSLSDHFDSFGKPRFKRLGLTFIAKQRLPLAHLSATGAAPEEKRRGDKSARAFIMSQEALAQDQKRWTEHTKSILDSIQEADRHKDEEVKHRQVSILFAELPKFLPLLPCTVPLELLEQELERPEEPNLRMLFLRMNRQLREPQGAWRFRRNEVLVVLQVLKAWALSSWPKGGGELGMERSSYCRFLLDMGLADQRKVPFAWAVQLFDASAKWMRYGASDDAMPQGLPLLPVVSWWDMMPIIEHLASQHFRVGTTSQRVKFMEFMAEIGRFRLPSFATRCWNITREHLELMLQGVGLDEEQEDPNSSKPRIVRVPGDKAVGHVAEEAARQRLRCLLCEPEVLALLWQHEAVFKQLHRCYADDRGHMSFAAVVQLCSDFSLAPKLISLHTLRKIYESLEALDLDLDDELGDSTGLSVAKATSMKASPASARQAVRRSSVSGAGSKTPQAESARRSSMSFQSAQKRATIYSKVTDASPAHSASVRGSRSGKARLSFGTTSQERSGLLFPWEVISLRLREASKEEPCGASLRAPALMELLCKVAYSYLGSYGNVQQRSMSTMVQTVWLLVYLRFTVESVRGSLQRRGAEEQTFGALGQAARRLAPDLWSLDVAPDYQDELSPATVKPLPPEVVRLTTKQAAEAPQEGQPYVVNQVCRVCKLTVQPGTWGNLRCYGCCKLDRLALSHHPLASMLRPSGAKPVTVAGKPPRLRPRALSPPPFQANDILAVDAEVDFEVLSADHSFDSSSDMDGSVSGWRRQ